MYLRCNHDNCRRIDWRTVHGLQCHIVKSHEQPKGTIGSLEKALDRYGVPVKEVEDYENEYGFGSGGTMADPKNLKIKNKMREAQPKNALLGARTSDPGPQSMSVSPPPGISPSVSNSGVRSIGFRPGTEPLGGSHMFPARYSSENIRQSHGEVASGDEADEETQKPAAFLMKPWNGPNDLQSVSALNKEQAKPRSEDDHEMSDAPVIERPTSPRTVVEPGDALPFDGIGKNQARASPASFQDAVISEVVADTSSIDANPISTPAEASKQAPPADKELQGIEASETVEEPTEVSQEVREKSEKALLEDSEGMERDSLAKESQPAPKSPVQTAPMNSPRATRKPASRRASLIQSKAQDEANANEEELSKAEGPTRDEHEQRDAEEDGSITVAPSPRTRNKENPHAGARPRRQTTGRFRKSRG